MNTNVRQSQVTDNKTIDLTSLNFEANDNALKGLSHIGDPVEDKPDEENPFPLHALPQTMQNIAVELRDKKQYPLDYSAGAALFAIATASGNKYRLRYSGYTAKPNLFIVIVGRPGANKSDPQTFFTAPLMRRDAIYDYQYRQALKEHREIIRNIKKQDNANEEPDAPVCKKVIESNATIEAILATLHDNNGGVGWFADEIVSITANLARYSGGNDDGFVLSMFNGSDLKISRKGDGQKLITDLCISLMGSIQPAALSELYRAGRKHNGFADRFILFYPDKTKAMPLSDAGIDPMLEEQWHTIVNRLLDIEYTSCFDPHTGIDNNSSKYIPYAADAWKVIKAWDIEAAANQDQETDEVSSIWAKLRVYIHRIALTLQLFRYACHEDGIAEVGIEAANGAVAITEYLFNNALKARTVVEASHSPLESLTATQQALYESLPEVFETKLAIVQAEQVGIKERRVKEFLKKRDLFIYISHGVYKKAC